MRCGADLIIVKSDSLASSRHIKKEMPDDHVEITGEPLSHDDIVARAHDEGAGAIVTFIGITRNVFEGKKVIKLEYECYVPMAGRASRLNRPWLHQLTCIVFMPSTNVYRVHAFSHRQAFSRPRPPSIGSHRE